VRSKIVLIAVLFVAVGCTSPSSSSAVAGVPSEIPQPVLPHDVPVAPDSQRVDLLMPTFSDPTTVDNPLFPVSQQASVVFVGHVDGKPFRTEVTLLPYTRTVDWSGVQIPCLVSQYTAYLDGRLQEVAYDLYAQAADGSVWYFGEDVVDVAHGDIVTKEGTWLAGKDGPAQMIMPGDPQVGDVFRTENIPGVAFEQVTVKDVGKTLDGPFGPIPGGMVGQELHMDGSTEDKLFAPGYGEFFTGGGGDVEALALAVPTDASTAPLPPALETMRTDADALDVAAASDDWKTADATLREMQRAHASLTPDEVPVLIGPWLDRAMGSLATAVRAHDAGRARQASIDTEQRVLDVELRYRPPTEINVDRMDLWAAQLQADAANRDVEAVNGDVFSLFYIRDRIVESLSPEVRTEVNTQVGHVQVAGPDGDLARATKAATALRAALGTITG